MKGESPYLQGAPGLKGKDISAMGASSPREDKMPCSQHEERLREKHHFCWDRSPNIFSPGQGSGGK